jgi:SPP1 family predicted phage head-tail adaptor
VIGALDRRITLEQPTETRDSYGEAVPVWAELATVFAEYEPLQGREQVEAQGINADLSARFRIRYRPDVVPTTKMRIVYDGQTYGIEAVTEAGRGRRRLVEMLARVVTA